MNFADALDVDVNSVEKPKSLPQGTYVWTVTKVPSITQNKSQEWDVVEFLVRVVSAESDVDPDDLDAFGSVTGVTNRVAFMSPTAPDKKHDREKTIYRIKQFLTEVLKVDAGEGATIKQLMAACPNHQFLGRAVWRQDGDETYVDLRDLTALV